MLPIADALNTYIASLPCSYGKTDNNPSAHGITGKIGARVLTMSFARGMTVSPPLTATLILSINFNGKLPIISVLFRAGTAFSPLFLIEGVSGWLFNEALLFSEWISAAGAGVVVLLELGCRSRCGDRLMNGLQR